MVGFRVTGMFPGMLPGTCFSLSELIKIAQHICTADSSARLSQKRVCPGNLHSSTREGELEVEDGGGVEETKGKKVPPTHKKSQLQWYFV